jgi:hypothetical protein
MDHGRLLGLGLLRDLVAHEPENLRELAAGEVRAAEDAPRVVVQLEHEQSSFVSIP